MTYTGDIKPGDPAQQRVVGCLGITKVAVDPQMSNNCYLLECQETGDLVLVDAADDAPLLLDLIGDRSLSAIVTTHQHWDHHRALATVIEAHPGAVVIAGVPDAEAITEQTGVSVDRPVEHGDTVSVGACELSVIAIAGHTPGSICLYHSEDGGHLFTGDSLFPGGVGATFGDADAFAQLIDDVESLIFGELADSVTFYPGHGNDGVLGNERASLAEWRERGW